MVALPKRIYLWSVGSPVLIVPASSGVIFCNQTDGVATVHREQEGIALPLPNVESEVFNPSWWERHFNHRVPGDEKDWARICKKLEQALNSIVASGEVPFDFKVLAHPRNAEAWVHVSFKLRDLGPSGDGNEWIEADGILTWENCD